ncbi:MAG: rRNA pseudouridine synthase [Oscillospiraceae bacterium]|nr:rRNA pseudouridine synthase [Oscillospiraceae bacterium]
MEERIQKILSGAGVCSRRGAEALILDGRVLINGEPAALGQRADPEADEIRVDGEIVRPAGPRQYYMLYKPRGCLTTLKDPRGRWTVADLIADIPDRVWPVGRLDLDSEGLLLLTDDGELTNRLLHPGFHVEKEYHVTVSGDVGRGLDILNGPMVLDGRELAPVQVWFLGSDGDRATLDFTLRQGLKRQIRRMCQTAGLEVKRLIRVREGPLLLGDLTCGTHRPLTDSEVRGLFRDAGLIHEPDELF